MKTKTEILQSEITDLIAETDKLTYFGKDDPARGLLNAVANAMVEAWTDIYQTKRGLQISLAEGTDLELLAERRGFTRLGATKSSCVVLFSGPATTIIPAGTIIKSSINPSAQYKTLEQITLGEANPNVLRPVGAESIGDIVIAESVSTGSVTAVNANELTELLAPINGVTVTNLTPSVGGQDAENDDQLRERMMQQFDLLNQGTQSFYEAIAKEVDSSIINAYAKKGDSGEAEVYVVKNSFALYSDSQLAELAESIYSRQRAFNEVVCKNATVRSIEIKCFLYLRAGYTFSSVFSKVASVIANYIEQQFAFGAVIKYQDILNLILDLDAVTGIDLSNFYLNNNTQDVQCLSNEVPRFTYLKIDSTSGSGTVNVEQTYLVI